jgi:Tetracyclin repressor-like, C-terminal domain
MAVANPKIAAFAIIEMAEGVPRWFRSGGDTSINQLAYLYGEFAHRLTSTTRHSPHDRGKACWKSMYAVTRSEAAAGA